MPDYGSWEELCEAAQKKCYDILKNDVAPVAEEIVRNHIQDDIYDAISPYTGQKYRPIPNGWVNGTTYQRRHVLEGSVYSSLLEDKPIEEGEDPFVLLVTSNATASDPVVTGYEFNNSEPGAFLNLLETGHMGIWRHGFPRPAIGNAQNEIDRSSAIRNAIQSGLDKYI